MNRVYYYVALMAILFALQACGGVRRVEKKPQLVTTPEKLGLFVNEKTDPYTVPVNYTLNIPKGYIPSCARLVYAPSLVALGHEYPLTPVVVAGKNYDRVQQRQILLDGLQPDYMNAMTFVTDGEAMQIQVDDVVPFDIWMPDAKVVANVILEACDQKKLLYTQTYDGGIIYIPQSIGPVEVKYVQKEVERREEGFAHFYYPVNGYSVDPALGNNGKQLDDMTNLIGKILADTSMHVNRIVITGICSPEGPWSYNEDLARKRAKYIEQYLESHSNVPESLIDVKYIAEDWDGLRKMVSDSNMEDKEAVLNVLDNVKDFGQRQAALEKLRQYSYIKQNFYPALRKVTYEVLYTVTETVQEVIPE